MADTITLRNKNTGEVVTLRRKSSSTEAKPSAETDLGFGNVEGKMNQELPTRPNPFTAGADSVKSLTMKDFIPGNVSGMGKQGMALLQVLGAPYQAAESVVANRALSGQKDLRTFLNPQEGLRDVVAGLTGPQKTMGDVNYRAGLNRGTADAAGLAQNIAVQAPQLVEGAYKLGSKGLSSMANFLSKSGQSMKNVSKSGFGNFHTKTLSEFDDIISNAGKKFDGTIQSISQKSTTPVDLQPVLLDVIDASDDSAKVASLAKRVPQLRKLLSGESSPQMTLAESQELYKNIGSLISPKKLMGEGLRPDDIPVMKFLRNSIRKAQIDSLPNNLMKGEFATARQEYGAVANDYKLLRKEINSPQKFVKTVNSYFDKNPILQGKAEKLSPEIASKIRDANRVQTAKKVAGGLLGLTAGGAATKVGYDLLRK